MEKGFFDIFKKYTTTPEKRDLLERGRDFSYSIKSRNPWIIEVNLSFSTHEDAELIYEIEDECRELYEAQTFKIFPHFPPSEWNISRFGEIAAEASLYGYVTN